MSEAITFYDPREAPFSIHGLVHDPMLVGYRRLPDPVAAATSDNVRWLCRHTAGGRVRFATDAPFLILRAKTSPKVAMPHCTPLMESGFDLYLDTPQGSIFQDLSRFDTRSYESYELRIPLPAGEKELTLNLPLYGEVLELSIGLPADATVRAHTPYRHATPIVYYGSSITQGACATRPGLSYQSYIARRLDSDYINLGFSGSALAEDAVVAYMADLDMAAFVSDYDHNAPTPEHLAATHHKLYEAIRRKHPIIPYLMVTRPNFLDTPDDRARREIVLDSYLAARRAGDENVYFIDGAAFFTPAGFGDCRNDYTVDGCHPNDAGFHRMAATIGTALSEALGW